MTTIAMIQARMSSSRLPGKVLKDLNGKTVLQHVCDAAQKISGIDKIVVLTSAETDDNVIEAWCNDNNIECFRGDLNDVLKRFYDAAKHYKAKTIIRLTADCPLLDPSVVGQLLLLFKTSQIDYCSNVVPPTWPDGLDCEVFSFDALQTAHTNAKTPQDREHVTRYIHHNRSLFSVRNMVCPIGNLSHHRWTLDTQNDFNFLEKLMQALPTEPSYIDIYNALHENPDLKIMDSGHETIRSSISQPIAAERSFSRSKKILERAEQTIPLGTQTFSKSRLNCAPGYAPLFASHGKGGRIWDVDGNEYVDTVMGLLPTSLGYCDPDIDNAIRTQLDNGITLSFSTELEHKLSEHIIGIVPSAEKVRFAKNGSDATSAAIRLARAFTNRDHIIVCGYHGWQDWYIGSTTRHKGIPQGVRDYTHKVDYNDLQQVEDLLKAHNGQIAALIMEPMNATLPKDGYLQDLKNLLHRHGAILIFDEVITGFRYAKGGAQEYFGVTPDLTALGKGMANGMPLSAIVGRSDIMNEMNNIFFSGTFGGESLSLAASLAVMKKLDEHPVIETLWKTGNKIRNNIEHLLCEYDLSETISFCGLAPWQLLQFKNKSDTLGATIKTYMLHELFKRGVFSLGSYNICYAHSGIDILKLTDAHDQVFQNLKTHLEKNNLESYMDYPTIQPVFQVRKSA